MRRSSPRLRRSPRVLGISAPPSLARAVPVAQRRGAIYRRHLARVDALENGSSPMADFVAAAAAFGPVGIPDCIADARRVAAAAAAYLHP
jgi:hypothetical protein